MLPPEGERDLTLRERLSENVIDLQAELTGLGDEVARRAERLKYKSLSERKRAELDAHIADAAERFRVVQALLRDTRLEIAALDAAMVEAGE